MRNRLILGILFASVVWPVTAQDAEHAFDYDKQASLDVQKKGTTKRGGVAILDISYASPKGGRVPAYLVVPSGKGPFAAVIWGHWYWTNSPARNRSEFLDEAVALAPTGVVSLLPDGPVARPGHVTDNDPLSERQATELIQQVVDMRRGADLLLARKEVDSQRLAYVGHSYDATVGAFLSGIDKRFKAFVLMAGGLSDEVDMKSKEYQEFRQKIGPEKCVRSQVPLAGSWEICVPRLAGHCLLAIWGKRPAIPHPRTGPGICPGCQRPKEVSNLRRPARTERGGAPRPSIVSGRTTEAESTFAVRRGGHPRPLSTAGPGAITQARRPGQPPSRPQGQLKRPASRILTAARTTGLRYCKSAEFCASGPGYRRYQMVTTARKTELEKIQSLRALYLQETNFQIRYDACHERGWTDSYLLMTDNLEVGYGSIKGKQTKDRDTVFEYFVVKPLRRRSSELFRQLLAVSGAQVIECQSNDLLLASMLYEFSASVRADVVLFEEHAATEYVVPGALVRPRRGGEQIFDHKTEPVGEYVVELNDEVVATGGFLIHYNRPFADLYMEVREDFRRRGIASFLLQELKRHCYLAGRVPAARCEIRNVASRAALVKAGLRICGFMLTGKVEKDRL